MIKHYNVTVNGTVYEVEVEETDGAAVSGTKPAAPAEKPAAAKPAAVKRSSLPVTERSPRLR